MGLTEYFENRDTFGGLGLIAEGALIGDKLIATMCEVRVHEMAALHDVFKIRDTSLRTRLQLNSTQWDENRSW